MKPHGTVKKNIKKINFNNMSKDKKTKGKQLSPLGF